MNDIHRQGWCPGALRPMESGDGLIVRLRIVGGALTPQLARMLAQCAADCGNGLIDLSSRGNLQLRGVRTDSLAKLQTRLDALGLLDRDPEVEAIRNILISPLAGADPSAVIDIRPFAQGLDEHLRIDPRLKLLPGKFLFAIDDGGRLPLPIEKADIGFIATQTADGATFAVYLAGTFAGTCSTVNLCEIATRLSHVFIDRRTGADRRMRDLLRHEDIPDVARAVGLSFCDVAPKRPAPDHILGTHDLGPQKALGIGIPFGRLDASALKTLADVAEAACGELRLSPWRAIFLIANDIQASLVESLAATGFIVDDTAPIRAVAACAGKPACLHGETPAQTDAARLATFARAFEGSGIAFHCSACAKGCAHPAPAPVTLVGRDGAYDLILDGCASDTPALHSLSLADLERRLPTLSEVAPVDRMTFIQNLLCEAAP